MHHITIWVSLYNDWVHSYHPRVGKAWSEHSLIIIIVCCLSLFTYYHYLSFVFKCKYKIAYIMEYFLVGLTFHISLFLLIVLPSRLNFLMRVFGSLLLSRKNDELRKEAVDALCCLAHALGEDFTIFIESIHKLLLKHRLRVLFLLSSTYNSTRNMSVAYFVL